MILYIYDGSFDGFLTAVYEGYYNNKKPEEILSLAEFQPTLLTEPIYVKTNIDKAKKVEYALRSKISTVFLSNVYCVFLSQIATRCSLLFQYIKLGFKLGDSVDLHLHNDIVREIHKIKRKVDGECHRLLGFVRFQSISNKFLYAPIEPDHDVLELICPHFAERLPAENWVIQDVKREKAAFYNTHDWIIAPLPKEEFETLSKMKKQDQYGILWQNYFKSITIESRENTRLQKMHMPTRYWKHLTEMNDIN